MKAVVQDTYGSADVLKFRDIDTPGIARDEVLIRVQAAGVSRGVWHIMTGLPYPIRLAGYGLRAPRTAVPGADLAGVVETVGQDVTRFQPGDEVFGIGTGAFAEYARAPENKLAVKPANLSFEQAAVVGVSGLTALQGLRDRGRVGPGQTVLIIGASGAWGPSRCSWPRRSGRRSPACAAPRRPTWSDPSAPTTSSTTRVRTSGTGRSTTT